MQKIVQREWDYTKHAEFYQYRPNYCKESIYLLKQYVQQNIGGGGRLKSC